MQSYRFNPQYDKAFHFFLSHTNEKQVLLQEINQRINLRGITSILDIGAGNGQLSIPLASLVPCYVAIEAKENYAQYLYEAGINVICATFPCLLNGRFDMVLISHAIPGASSSYEPFFINAWRHVNAGGMLCGITYDHVQSEWTRFLALQGLTQHDTHSSATSPDNHFAKMSLWLFQLGIVKMATVMTHVTTKTVEEMIQALAFVYSDGETHKIRRFLKKHDSIAYTLSTSYWQNNNGVYQFPFEHIIMDVIKD